MGSELIQLLEQEARAEKDKVLAEARTRANEIAAAARKDAEAIAVESRRRVEAEREQIQARAVSTASLRAAALVLEAKDKAIQAVFARATEELTRASQDPARRRALLRNLIAEAAEGLGGRGGTLEVPPGDAEAARATCQALGLGFEVKESPNVSGGVRLITADRRVAVENTIASRLGRTRSALISRVAETLWGA